MMKMGIVIGILIGGLILICGFYPDNLVRAQEDSYTIEVDESSKTVHSGEDAIFIWYLENNEQLTIYEFYPFADDDRNNFKPESIILNPGESGIVIQTFNTTGLNSSFTDTFTTGWLIKVYIPFNNSKYELTPFQGTVGRLEVIISENETINEDSNGDGSDKNSFPQIILGINILIAILISYYIFQKRKQS